MSLLTEQQVTHTLELQNFPLGMQNNIGMKIDMHFAENGKIISTFPKDEMARQMGGKYTCHIIWKII